MAKKVKIVHIITRLITGGADENTILTVNGLDSEKYDILLITGKDSESSFIESINFNNNVEIKIIDSLVRRISLINDIKAFFLIFNILKKEEVTIVHTHTAKAGVLGRAAAWLSKVPIIIHSLHGTTFPKSINFFKRLLFKNIERVFALVTDIFLAVGNDLKEIYLQAGIGEEKQYKIVHSGMQLEKFVNSDKTLNFEIKRKYNIGSDKIVIGKVAKLNKRKGYKYYLELATRIANNYSNVIFLIIGDGEEKSNLEKDVLKRNLEDKVIFTGYIENVEEIFSIIDIKVFTSLWEGLPRVLVQAAAVGIPIVSFAVEGAGEIVENDVNGYIVPLRNIDLLEKHVIKLLEKEDLRKTMGENGKSKIDSSWSVKNMLDEIESVYCKLLDNKKLFDI